MKCEIESFTVTDVARSVNTMGQFSTAAVVQSVCRTHNWQFQPGQPVGAGDMCPIGRVEDAVEKGVQALDYTAHLPPGYLLHFYHDQVPKGWEIMQTITSEGGKPIVLCKKVEA